MTTPHPRNDVLFPGLSQTLSGQDECVSKEVQYRDRQFYVSTCSTCWCRRPCFFRKQTTLAWLQQSHPLYFKICVLTELPHYWAMPGNSKKQMALPHSPLETNSNAGAFWQFFIFHSSTGTDLKTWLRLLSGLIWVNEMKPDFRQTFPSHWRGRGLVKHTHNPSGLFSFPLSFLEIPR